MSEPVRKWTIAFTNGDQRWTQTHVGTFRDAEDFAASLCYQPSTRFTMIGEPVQDEPKDQGAT